jgi:hypothetical protein
MLLSPSVVFPKNSRLCDVLCLTGLVAAKQQQNDPVIFASEIDAITGTILDF